MLDQSEETAILETESTVRDERLQSKTADVFTGYMDDDKAEKYK